MKTQESIKQGVEVIARQYGADVSGMDVSELESAIAFTRLVMIRSKMEFLEEFEDAMRVLAAARATLDEGLHA